MKCEKCNQNEASFFFEKNLNGHKESLHLCHACAEAEGLLQSLNSGVGFIATLKVMGIPFAMPPFMPPLLLLFVLTTPLS